MLTGLITCGAKVNHMYRGAAALLHRKLSAAQQFLKKPHTCFYLILLLQTTQANIQFKQKLLT